MWTYAYHVGVSKIGVTTCAYRKKYYQNYIYYMYVDVHICYHVSLISVHTYIHVSCVTSLQIRKNNTIINDK